MNTNVGKKVVYPNQGPCRIGAVIEKAFAGRSTSVYPLAVLDDSGDVLFVPVNKFKIAGMRKLIEKSEIPKLLMQLNQEAETASASNTATNWKQRALDNSKLLSSGQAFDLVKIIGSLTELGETRALSLRDREALDKARKNLICEISEVMGETKGAAAKQVDDALKIATRKIKNSQ